MDRDEREIGGARRRIGRRRRAHAHVRTPRLPRIGRLRPSYLQRALLRSRRLPRHPRARVGRRPVVEARAEEEAWRARRTAGRRWPRLRPLAGSDGEHRRQRDPTSRPSASHVANILSRFVGAGRERIERGTIADDAKARSLGHGRRRSRCHRRLRAARHTRDRADHATRDCADHGAIAPRSVQRGGDEGGGVYARRRTAWLVWRGKVRRHLWSGCDVHASQHDLREAMRFRLSDLRPRPRALHGREPLR